MKDSDEIDAYNQLSIESLFTCEDTEEAAYSGSPRDQASMSDMSSSGASEWSEQEWPAAQPLPVPLYGSERPRLAVCSLDQLLRLQESVAAILRDALQAHPYDSLSAFFQFCKEYNQFGSDYDSLHDFFRDYDMPISDERHTCVGLVDDLQRKLYDLEAKFPGIIDSMYPVSCDEKIKYPDIYCAGSYPPFASCDKEHLLLCVSFAVEERTGVMLMDPGYHVAEPIIVMEDGRFPQSPTYQAVNGDVVKTYTYKFHEGNTFFVEWNVKKGDKLHTSLVYVKRPFLSGLDNAERRNLVYPVKTIINRQRDGDIKSGLYLALKRDEEQEVVFLIRGKDESFQKVRIPLQYFNNSFSTQLVSSNTKFMSHKRFQDEFDWEEVIQRVGNDTGRPEEIIGVLGFLSALFNNNLTIMQEVKEINEQVKDYNSIN